MANSNNSANVAIIEPKVGGAVFVAPKGTALPINATTALADTYKCLGYVDEDGLKETTTRTSEDVKEWGTNVVAAIQTEFSEEYKLTFLEMNEEVAKLRYGAENVEASGGKVTKVRHNSKMIEPVVMVVEMADKNSKRIVRKVVGLAQVTAVDEIDYGPSAPMKFGFTIKALAGAWEGNDDCVVDFWAEAE